MTAKDYIQEHIPTMVGEHHVSSMKLTTLISLLNGYTSQSKWVSCAERLPDIDVDDEWNKNNKISKDVLTYSKEWGIRFGRYFYHANFWTINGVTSSNGVEVEFWQIINKPVEK